MTKKETATFLGELLALYPNMTKNINDPAKVLYLWEESLKNHTFQDIHNALIMYFQIDTKGYVPTAGQLIELIESKHTEPYLDDEHEFWGYE